MAPIAKRARLRFQRPDELCSLRLQGTAMNDARLTALEQRLMMLEDKVATLVGVVAKYGLLSPDVVELRLSVSALTLVVAEEAAKNARTEVQPGSARSKTVQIRASE